MSPPSISQAPFTGSIAPTSGPNPSNSESVGIGSSDATQSSVRSSVTAETAAEERQALENEFRRDWSDCNSHNTRKQLTMQYFDRTFPGVTPGLKASFARSVEEKYVDTDDIAEICEAMIRLFSTFQHWLNHKNDSEDFRAHGHRLFDEWAKPDGVMPHYPYPSRVERSTISVLYIKGDQPPESDTTREITGDGDFVLRDYDDQLGYKGILTEEWDKLDSDEARMSLVQGYCGATLPKDDARVKSYLAYLFPKQRESGYQLAFILRNLTELEKVLRNENRVNTVHWQ
jgi:hypothetical protein